MSTCRFLSGILLHLADLSEGALYHFQHHFIVHNILDPSMAVESLMEVVAAMMVVAVVTGGRCFYWPYWSCVAPPLSTGDGERGPPGK